jgi:hypothetical protein
MFSFLRCLCFLFGGAETPQKTSNSWLPTPVSNRILDWLLDQNKAIIHHISMGAD